MLSRSLALVCMLLVPCLAEVQQCPSCSVSTVTVTVSAAPNTWSSAPGAWSSAVVPSPASGSPPSVSVQVAPPVVSGAPVPSASFGAGVRNITLDDFKGLKVNGSLLSVAPIFALTFINPSLAQKTFHQTGPYGFSVEMYSQNLTKGTYDVTPALESLLQVPETQKWIFAHGALLAAEWLKGNMRNMTGQPAGAAGGLLAGGLTAVTGKPATEVIPVDANDLWERIKNFRKSPVAVISRNTSIDLTPDWHLPVMDMIDTTERGKLLTVWDSKKGMNIFGNRDLMFSQIYAVATLTDPAVDLRTA